LDSNIEYRNLYQTRHTFITAALETPILMPDGGMRMLEAKDIAKERGYECQDDLRALCRGKKGIICTGVLDSITELKGDRSYFPSKFYC
jgi:hypothetical protein